VTLSANTAGDFPTATATFNTNASVAAQCNVSAANLSFGTVDPVSSQVDATTALTVNCTKNSAYTVGLDAGVTAGATIAQRLMANGADTMPCSERAIQPRRRQLSGKHHHGDGDLLAKLPPIRRACPPPSPLLYSLSAPVVTPRTGKRFAPIAVK
jgi:hypothetical protein